jgi:hypothetical protein
MTSGGRDDYSLIMTLLANHAALCMRCLVTATELSPDDVDSYCR